MSPHDARPDVTMPASRAEAGSPGWQLRCLACDGLHAGRAHDARCPACGGVTEPYVATTSARVHDDPVPERAFSDFLPEGLAELVDAGTSVRTPIVRLPSAEQALGLDGLWLKDESGQPSGSTKDRCAALVTAAFRAAGVSRFIASSTGNTARALARAVSRDPAMEAHFVVGRDFPVPPHFGAPARVTSTVVDGPYGEATRRAEQLAATEGWTSEGGFGSWARREGAKLAYLEAFLALPRPPDVVVQSVSSGLGVLAADKAARELAAATGTPLAPRFVLVQEETCAPMVSAYGAGRRSLSEADVVSRPHGLSTAILHGDPHLSYPYMESLVRRSGGHMVAVTRSAILAARHRLIDDAGIDACHASAAALAGLTDLVESGEIAPGSTALVLIGGRPFDDRPDPTPFTDPSDRRPPGDRR